MPLLTKAQSEIAIGSFVVVRIKDCGRPMYGVLVGKTERRLRARIIERDPVWHGAQVSNLTAKITAAKSEDKGTAELSWKWGVSVTNECIRCRQCGTKNTIARLDTLTCLSCVMKRERPRS